MKTNHDTCLDISSPLRYQDSYRNSEPHKLRHLLSLLPRHYTCDHRNLDIFALSLFFATKTGIVHVCTVHYIQPHTLYTLNLFIISFPSLQLANMRKAKEKRVSIPSPSPQPEPNK
ncbi:hypothetical protein QBC38DRAFT_129330 [Podospora fimiseda]|uniref:Uncharacterized protein n=1 Tax=Podospora fimiseda TaxID=252190 RepID=A0AAN7H2I2_9PEZI|nr:hypothetical protein QBC38DRAFT_129330 [Podospora fimiseda]